MLVILERRRKSRGMRGERDDGASAGPCEAATPSSRHTWAQSVSPECTWTAWNRAATLIARAGDRGGPGFGRRQAEGERDGGSSVSVSSVRVSGEMNGLQRARKRSPPGNLCQSTHSSGRIVSKSRQLGSRNVKGAKDSGRTTGCVVGG